MIIRYNDRTEHVYNDIFTEATGESTEILKEYLDPIVKNTLSNSTNDRKFKSLINDYINRNINKLTTSGPVFLIPFTDIEKGEYLKIFGIDFIIHKSGKSQGISVPEIQNRCTEITKKINDKAGFKLLIENPILVLFYFCIRYYSMKGDSKSLNMTLTIYALAAYPSMFTKYFKHGVNESIMQYTIDNLTNKYIIKKEKHIFGALTASIQNSYKFHKNMINESNDKQIISFIQRIRNDQNSMLKKISNEYYNNHKKGLYISTRNDSFDDSTPIIDDVTNSTTAVMNIAMKVTMPIISNGVDIVLAEASAKMAKIGISDCRFYLTKIIVDKNINPLQEFISSLLFLYLYDNRRRASEINSSHFLAWSASLFKKTNSKNENIIKINTTLNEWAEDSGIYNKYKREASRINYKKAIFFYIVMSIQKYNH